MIEKTLVLIKPDGVKNGHIGEIVGRFEKRGFKILHIRMLELNSNQASNFYSLHNDKPFFNNKFGVPTNAAQVSNPPANKNWLGNLSIDSNAAGNEYSNMQGK